MNEIVEKYENKLQTLNNDIENSKHQLNKSELEIVMDLRVLLTEVVTDMRAVKLLTQKD